VHHSPPGISEEEMMVWTCEEKIGEPDIPGA
jgi:hypothetical protein